MTAVHCTDLTPLAFAPWLDAVAQSDLPGVQTFAEGLKQDEPAILAALALALEQRPVGRICEED